MIYGIKDRPPFFKLLGFSAQIMMACFTATILIANILGVDSSGVLVGEGIATIIYVLLTGFNCPMIISSSGALVTPVLVAMSAGGYTAIAIGGVVSAIVYIIFGIIFSKIPVDNIYKVFPKVLIGSVTIVIGINLMSFIPGYIGDTGNVGIVLALITVVAIAISSHYLKGTLSLFPFLIGTLVGYICAIPFGLVDFSYFTDVKFIQIPTFAFTQWKAINFVVLIPVIIIYVAYTISGLMECLSDHAAESGIIGVDLYKNPGLSKIFFGMGAANIASSCIGGLGACSYGEGIATVGFSKCASIYATIGAALLMILLGFIGPVKAFVQSIPSCVIGGGTACVLYGFISSSGIKMLKDVNLNNQKNLIICSVVLSLGISGVVIGNETLFLSGTALALVTGVILNLILKEKTDG